MKKQLLLLLLQTLGSVPLCVSRILGLWGGWLLAKGKSRSWYVTMANLELCFPDMSLEQRQTLALHSLQHTATMALEVFAVWRQGSWQRFKCKIVEIEGEHLFKQAIEDQRGLIILAPHHGNWELVGQFLGQYTNYVALFKPSGSETLDDYIIRSRSQGRMEVAPTNARGVMAVMKKLKAGSTTGILPDQVPADMRGGGFAPFFGQQAFTMTLIHKLHTKTKAQLLMMFAQRVKGGFKIVIREPHQAIYSSDEQQALCGLNTSIEDLVLLAPEQYQWEYKRFRLQPDNGAELYHMPKGWFKKLKNRLRGKV